MHALSLGRCTWELCFPCRRRHLSLLLLLTSISPLLHFLRFMTCNKFIYLTNPLKSQFLWIFIPEVCWRNHCIYKPNRMFVRKANAAFIRSGFKDLCWYTKHWTTKVQDTLRTAWVLISQPRHWDHLEECCKLSPVFSDLMGFKQKSTI